MVRTLRPQGGGRAGPALPAVSEPVLRSATGGRSSSYLGTVPSSLAGPFPWGLVLGNKVQ